MTGALLFGYAFILLIGIAPALRQAGWVDRAPRTAITSWLVLTFSGVGAIILGGLGWALPLTELSEGLAEMFSACAAELRRQYSSPVGALTGGVGALVAVGTAGRVTAAVLGEFRNGGAIRRRQRAALRLVATRGPGAEVWLVPCERAAAYCVPGRAGGAVVLTSAARDRLGAHELDAVVAHERAHLAGRHHVVVALTAGVARAFPSVRAFAYARQECARLLELAADDRAARRVPRLSIASALLALGDCEAPVGLLGAGGSTAAQRAHRMLTPLVPLSRVRVTATLAAATVAALLPLIIAITPAVMTLGQHYCPLPPAAGTWS